MVLPVVAYGDPVLKKVGEDINSDYPNSRAHSQYVRNDVCFEV